MKELGSELVHPSWWNVLKRAIKIYFGSTIAAICAMRWKCSGYGDTANVCEIRIHDEGYIPTRRDVDSKNDSSQSMQNMEEDVTKYFRRAFFVLLVRKTICASFWW